MRRRPRRAALAGRPRLERPPRGSQQLVAQATSSSRWSRSRSTSRAAPGPARSPRRGRRSGSRDRTRDPGSCRGRRDRTRAARDRALRHARVARRASYDRRMRLADRMPTIGTETAFEAAARARALEATGRSVIHLEIGEPDFDTPANIRDAAQAGARRRLHALRAVPRPAGRCARRSPPTPRPARASPVSADTSSWSPGAKPIMFYAMLALVEEGDEVVYPDPGFPIYESMARFAGATAVPVRDPPGERLPARPRRAGARWSPRARS